MITDEPYIYYVRCNNHPNLAIQANSRRSIRVCLTIIKVRSETLILSKPR